MTTTEHPHNMRDCDVRSALRSRLGDEHSKKSENTLVLEELGLCGQVRVDIAVVNEALTGYEIKSAADDLRRLPLQAEVYSRVFDYVHLVVAARHEKAAGQLIPGWWGVCVARTTSESVVLEVVRPATRNEAVNRMFLAQLLWREEALDELHLRDADRGVRSQARWQVWGRLVDVLTVDEMRDVVRARLMARQDWRAGPPRQQGDAT